VTHFSFLSTYPPTRCGLATFTDSLSNALETRAEPSASIVRVLDQFELRAAPVKNRRAAVVAHLVAHDPLSMSAGIRALDASDVAIVQHEYGIYGGPDGDEVVGLLQRLRVPSIVVLHTVLPSPTNHQREVLNDVCRLAGAIVVMTDHALETLTRGYIVNLDKVHVIPHGVTEWAAKAHEDRKRMRILTWGLISPGKGIEWGIRAVAELRSEGIDVEYVVAGQTHPKVRAHEGERYREMLAGLVDELALGDSVTLDDEYRDLDELGELVGTADVVLLPYDSREQVTSGVLAEAVAAGVPVVATGFPHAIELLADGSGLIALHEDPTSMATALRTILTTTDLAEQMHNVALSHRSETSWSTVAGRYRAVAETLVAARAA
jgi:glycosyltransferase involved in cell wall biosynthesis